jgi:ketosteroid isomerase-like protein
MDDRQMREALDAHWQASAAGDLNAEHDIYADDVICEYPQSGERIVGRSNLQALRGYHPDKPSGFDVRRVQGSGNLWVTEYSINYKTQAALVVSIMEFADGKVVCETQYFSAPFEAPEWRARWAERSG